MDAKNKIALVTGATRGIGKEISLVLAQSGYKVIGTATSDNGAEEINTSLKEYNGLGMILNVANKKSIENLIDSINNQFGDITILINNAGITKDNLLMRMKEDEWDDVINVNLKSIFLLSKAVIRNMLKNRYGRIVNITSVVAFSGNMGQCNYSSAKGGIVSFSKSLALEVGSRNITVNCVAPGFIETDMTNKLSKELQEEYINKIPLKRLGNAKDIANAVKFLVSDEASYITGTTIHVNGGLY